MIDAKYDGYDLVDQWTSYGWNVFTVDERQRLRPGGRGAEDAWRSGTRRTAARWSLIGKTVKGYWPAAVDGKIPERRRSVVGYPSHPYAHEDELGVLRRAGRRRSRSATAWSSRASATARVKDTRERLIQFKTNMDVAMSVLDQQRPRRLAGGPAGGDRRHRSTTTCRCAFDVDARSVPGRAPARGEPAASSRRRSRSRTRSPARRRTCSITLFRKAGRSGRHAARHLRNRQVDELRHRQPLPHASPPIFPSRSTSSTAACGATTIRRPIPLGTRLKAAIQEAGNVSTAIGLVSQSASRRSRRSSPACGRSAAPTARSRR